MSHELLNGKKGRSYWTYFKCIAFNSMAPVPSVLIVSNHWLNEVCSVPGPQSPSLDMNPKFFGSETEVALQNTTRALGRRFWSSTTLAASNERDVNIRVQYEV